MTEQKEHYDEHIARYRFLLERYGLSPPELTASIEKHKIFYLVCRLIYAIEDSLSFLFGNIKLYFSLIASYYQRSDAGAADDLHASLQSWPDLLIILGLGIPLVIVQVLGAYLSDSPDLNTNNTKYFFAKILAPYLRDVLQGIKWAYKGMRSVLNMVFYFMASHKELVLKILFPLSLAIAGLSLLNRIFLRTLRNFRKKKQSENRKTSLEILEEGYVLKFRQEMPTDDKNLLKLKKSLVYVPDEKKGGCVIYYVNATGTSKELEFDTTKKDNIIQKVQQYQSDNIRHRLELEFLKGDIDKIYFLSKELDRYFQYKNSLVFLADDKLDNRRRLIIVDEDGKGTVDPRSEYFIKSVKQEINNKHALNLYGHQIEELTSFIDSSDELGLSFDEWIEIKKKKQIKTLPGWLVFFCYASVILSALIDGSYFYIGVIFMATFNPAAFIAMMAMAAIMITVCLFGRIYEEYCFPKAFASSKT